MFIELLENVEELDSVVGGLLVLLVEGVVLPHFVLQFVLRLESG